MELKNILSGLEGLKVKGDLTIDITNIDSYTNFNFSIGDLGPTWDE